MKTKRKSPPGEYMCDKEYRTAYVQADYAMMFGSQLSHTRKARKLTIAQLSKLSGVSQDTIRRLENCDFQGAKTSTLFKLAEALDVGVVTRFVPFSDIFKIKDVSRGTRDPFAIPSFSEEYRV